MLCGSAFVAAARSPYKHRVYLLAIDLGTSGPKVALVSDNGDIAASATRAIQTHFVPPHGAEQDPEEIWDAILDAIDEVLRRASVPPAEIEGITCASQYFSIVPVDREARPLDRLILWMDTRGAPWTRSLYEHHAEAFPTWVDVHGMVPLPSGIDSLSHMLWVRHERPELYARTHKFLEPVDYVTARLSGECVSSLCTAFPLLLTDNRDLSRCEYAPELLAMAGIDREKLAGLVAPNRCIGSLRPQLAQRLGLEPGTRIFSGVNDTQAVSVGTATFRGTGGINIGTTCQVLAHVPDKRADFENEILSMPSPIAGRYMAMAENGLGAKTLDHFLRNIVFASDALADHAAANPFAGVDAAVESVAPGSDGLLFLPWLNGSSSPCSDPNARGGFLNLSLRSTRSHLVRAVLEGVAFNLRWLLPAVEKLAETRFDELMFAGGGAVSDAWAQIMADMMNRPVAQLADARHVNNRATAFLGFVELGVLGLDDIDRLCRVRRRYEPRPAHTATYDHLFPQFLAAFERNRPIFGALNGDSGASS